MPAPIAVLGAGGRAGRAVLAEATRRDLAVTAIVRDPARHADLEAPGVSLRAADALDAAAIARAAAGARAVVSAVTPFSAPPTSFDGFDTAFYRRVADSLLALPGAPRLVFAGLFATLTREDGMGLVMDDPARFPPALVPFARAHALELEHLGAATADWVVLAPPPALAADLPRTGRYELGDSTVDPDRAQRPLSYADLAVAVLDAVERPSASRAQLAVYGS